MLSVVIRELICGLPASLLSHTPCLACVGVLSLGVGLSLLWVVVLLLGIILQSASGTCGDSEGCLMSVVSSMIGEEFNVAVMTASVLVPVSSASVGSIVVVGTMAVVAAVVVAAVVVAVVVAAVVVAVVVVVVVLVVVVVFFVAFAVDIDKPDQP